VRMRVQVLRQRGEGVAFHGRVAVFKQTQSLVAAALPTAAVVAAMPRFRPAIPAAGSPPQYAQIDAQRLGAPRRDSAFGGINAVSAVDAEIAIEPLDMEGVGRDLAQGVTPSQNANKKWSRGESNPRARRVFSEKDASSARRAAPGAARRARVRLRRPDPDPALARVAAAWPDLPEPVRRGIVAMVEGVRGNGEGADRQSP
jgi:hypothetical protein